MAATDDDDVPTTSDDADTWQRPADSVHVTFVSVCRLLEKETVPTQSGRRLASRLKLLNTTRGAVRYRHSRHEIAIRGTRGLGAHAQNSGDNSCSCTARLAERKSWS
jgi:hypothetical protein